MSIKLRKLVSGFKPPVLVEHLGFALQDTIRTGLMGETVVHGTGAPAHLPEIPFQDIGGADESLALLMKGLYIKTIYIIYIYII